MIGIYKITSPSGKVYIGQSWNIERRWKHYNSYDLTQRKLKNSLNKYGVKNHVFEIIHELPEDITQEILDRYEQLYMDLYRNAGVELMNLREGGSKGKASEETKKLMSLKRMGNKSNTGRILSKEHKQNISKGLQGKSFKFDHLKKYLKQAVENSKKVTSKIVYQYDLKNNFKKEYPSVKEASRQTNIKFQNICNCALGNQTHSGGFIWKYKKIK